MPARKKSPAPLAAKSLTPRQSEPGLLHELRDLIVSTRQTVARGVNAALVLLYWKIGQRIRQDVLQNKRAEYGAEILPTLSAKLGWSHFVELHISPGLIPPLERPIKA